MTDKEFNEFSEDLDEQLEQIEEQVRTPKRKKSAKPAIKKAQQVAEKSADEAGFETVTKDSPNTPSERGRGGTYRVIGGKRVKVNE